MDKRVIIIGAGPAGLAVAGSLVQRGVQAVVLERAEQVGSSWRSHYERLHLHTVKTHSALPGLPFADTTPQYAPRLAVVDYLEQYARHFDVRPLYGQQVLAIRPDVSGWAVTTGRGDRFQADAVVIASGANRHPRVLEFAGQPSFQGKIVHSDQYRNAEPFKGRRVLVVGMGNTGAEIALDLVEQGVSAALSVRAPVNIVRRDVLGRPTQLSSIALSRLPPAVGDRVATLLRNLTVGSLRRWGLETADQSPLRQLREQGKTPVIDVGTVARIRRGEIPVHPGIARFSADGVQFTNGQTHAFDAVVLATGYEARLQDLLPETTIDVDANGMPLEVIGRGSREGLFFVGFDIRQPGGLLRTIASQAKAVAAELAS